eukprot:1854522-Prymnesium_polylepis.1
MASAERLTVCGTHLANAGNVSLEGRMPRPSSHRGVLVFHLLWPLDARRAPPHYLGQPVHHCSHCKSRTCIASVPCGDGQVNFTVGT